MRIKVDVRLDDFDIIAGNGRWLFLSNIQSLI